MERFLFHGTHLHFVLCLDHLFTGCSRLLASQMSFVHSQEFSIFPSSVALHTAGSLRVAFYRMASLMGVCLCMGHKAVRGTHVTVF